MPWSCCWIFVLSVLAGVREITSTRTCEPIRIELCKNLGYNVTGMPNLLGHDLQQDAQLQLQTFAPLIQYGCASRLRFFLCSVYVPMCTEKVPQPIGPCRPLCEDVKDRCEPVLQEFGFPWPAGLNCSKFPPENNDKNMCMEGPEPGDHERNYRRTSYPIRGGGRRPGSHRSTAINSGPQQHLSPAMAKERSHHYGLCQKLRMSDQYYYINRTGRCAPLCTADILFTHENKSFAQTWVTIWAVVCFLSTLFTVLTFLMDASQFRYPERAIVILSVNYNVYSIAYFIRLMAGRGEVACHLDSQHGVPILIQEGLDNVNCTIVFVLLYFFGMASAIWWVILSFTWFLAVGLHWTHEAIERRCTYFHLVAWALSSAKTIAVLVLRSVDADELTGTCFVGNQRSQTLMLFVIIPSLVYLIVGALFLFCGMVAKWKSRKQSLIPTTPVASKSAEKMEVVMARIGIFALLYTISALCVVVAYLYEYSSRDQWVSAGSTSRPNVEIFILKIFMSLVVGITTGLWIWSSKTPLRTWSRATGRLTNRKQPKALLQAYVTPTITRPPPSKKNKHAVVVDKPMQMRTVVGCKASIVV